MHWKIISGLLLLLLAFSELRAQDPLFTQFYSTPLYLNPAFAGATEQFRVSTAYRNQWTAIPRSLETNILSFDYHLIGQNSGVGVYLINDRMGAMNLSQNGVVGQYAYYLRVSDTWNLRAGLQLGAFQRMGNFSKLTFGDQLLNGGGATQENLEDVRSGYLDISTGFLAYSDRFWVGVAIHHLNEPNAGLAIPPTPLPMRQSFHLGAKLPFANQPQAGISPALLYQRQGPFDQLDFGINFFYSPLLAGIWYRGLPIAQAAEARPNQDALAILTGIQHGNFRFGYSYDLTLSGLQGVSGGSHEVTIVFEPPATNKFKRKAKGKRFVQCPAFYYY